MTSDYSVARPTMLELLNDPVATDTVCMLRYRRHHCMASGIQSKSIAYALSELLQNVPADLTPRPCAAEK